MKLTIKENRNRLTALAFIFLSGFLAVSIIANAIIGSLAWHFYSTQRTITTPMFFNKPFSSDLKSGDADLMSMLVTSFVYLRLTVSPETIDAQQKALLKFVPAAYRDEIKKTLDVEAEKLKSAGVTSRFQITEIQEEGDGVWVVRGTLSASTTNGALNDIPKMYRIRLQYVGGLISLDDFSEIKIQPKK